MAFGLERHVPIVAVAIEHPRAAICVKVGDHVEDFVLRTVAMNEQDLGASVLDLAETMMLIYMSDESYQRRLARDAGVDRPIRDPVLIERGPHPLYDRAIYLLARSRTVKS